MSAAMGAMNIQARNITAVVKAVRPVRPPASTPEPDSMNVVTVEVPVHAPATVPTASASRASFILGILPSLSSISALAAVPTRVPMVSNISIMQKVMIKVSAVNQPISIKVLKSNLKKVVSSMSLRGGTKDAPCREAKGLTSRKMKLPAQ